MSDIYLSLTETPTVVTLSQPVIGSSVAATVTVANTVTVALDANSLSALEQVTVTVGAAVSVSNFPATQVVSVSNFPASSSVTISGFSTSSLPPSTVTVGNSVTIGNFPSTQTIAGTVTANVNAGDIFGTYGRVPVQTPFLRPFEATAVTVITMGVGGAGPNPSAIFDLGADAEFVKVEMSGGWGGTVFNDIELSSSSDFSSDTFPGSYGSGPQAHILIDNPIDGFRFQPTTNFTNSTDDGVVINGGPYYFSLNREYNPNPVAARSFRKKYRYIRARLTVPGGGGGSAVYTITGQKLASLPAISGTVSVGNSVTIGSISAAVLPRWEDDNQGGNQRTAKQSTPFPVRIYGDASSTSVTFGATITNSVTIGSLPAISGTVTAAAPNGSLTTRFGTPTTANVSFATAAVTKSDRKYLLIQNVTTGSNVITVGIGFTPTTTQGIQLTAGAGITFESSYIPTGAVYVLSSVTASNFTILEG